MDDLAFIGLGAMGYPMAGHLARKGHRVLVHNRTAAVADRHAREFGSVQVDLEGTAYAHVVFTCLPTSRDVDQVARELKGHLRAGTIWVDATSGDPTAARETARGLEEQGVHYLDAPVSGGVPGAQAGTLTTMVGGDAKVLGTAREAMSAYAAKVVHVGPVGSGHALKAINNTLLAIHVLAAAEGLYALERNGISLATALEVLNASSGRSLATEKLLPKPLESDEFPLTFKLGLLEKDVRIGAGIVRDAGLQAPLTALAVEVVRNAKSELGPDVDYLAMARLVRG